MSINVVAVDDHDVALVGIRCVLEESDECNLVGGFPNVDSLTEFLRAPDAPPVDLVLLDLRLGDESDPYMNVVRLRQCGLKVLVFSAMESPFFMRRALLADVNGMVQKSVDSAELIGAIKIAAADDTYATSDWASLIDSDPLAEAIDLTERQQEILVLYASGMTADSVARATGLKAPTVQDHLNRIRRKYVDAGRAAVTKVELYRRAQQDGYIRGPLDH
ncbi:response regulator [Corynebacterium sp. CCM 9185]|uniref:Response regulator transcription factor n=1 Tax=Corynebacterium marambiense TaxID=2765364 RepID=A0ABS0VV22_9CORY|nr:response regulator [Corynebacterium marambiense]MBI9000631.1 response regulator transcription factor [Corynebacterium marambiense]MCK7663106.1 response regulator [Corynebacterium marambiense]